MPNNSNMLGYPGMPGMLAPQEEEELPGMLGDQPRSLERLRQRVTQARGPGWDIPYSEANPEMPGLGFTQAPTPLQMFSMQLNSPFEADRGEAALESIKYAIDAVIPAGLGTAAWQAMKGNKALPPISGTFGGPAFHGSPHRFDKFDIDKIGTGEGAQAYGHGLYFAESPGVAKSYRHLGGNATVTLDGANIDRLTTIPEEGAFGAVSMVKSMGDIDDALAAMDDAVRANRAGNPNSAVAARWLRKNRKRIDVTPSGSLYEVDIPDEQIAQMLDWDKPLSEQGEVVESLADKYGIARTADGGTLVETLKREVGEVGASETLREAGIPGIRYLDQASRAEGKGTRNLVLFSDENINILKRDGKAILPMDIEALD